MMNIRISILIVLCSLFITMLEGQVNINPRIVKRNGITLSGGGPGLYGSLSYDYFLNGNVNIETGAGPYTFFAGIKYHIGGEKNKNWTTYIGGYAMYIWIFEIFEDDDNDSPQGWYFPLGLQYTSQGSFSFAVEIAALYGVGEFFGFGSLKISYRF